MFKDRFIMPALSPDFPAEWQDQKRDELAARGFIWVSCGPLGGGGPNSEEIWERPIPETSMTRAQLRLAWKDPEHLARFSMDGQEARQRACAIVLDGEEAVEIEQKILLERARPTLVEIRILFLLSSWLAAK